MKQAPKAASPAVSTNGEANAERRQVAGALLGIMGASLAACAVDASTSEPEPERLGEAGLAFTELLTYQAVRDLTAPPGSTVLYVRGRVGDADGGQGLFHWNPDSTAPDDDGVVLLPDYVDVEDPGRWIRVGADVMNVRWFGAMARSGVDNHAAFQAAFDALPPSGGAVYVPAPTASELAAWVADGKPAYEVHHVASNTFASYEVLVTGKSRIRWFGDGPASCIRYARGASPSFDFYFGFCCDDLTIESLCFEGENAQMVCTLPDDPATNTYGPRRRFTVRSCRLIGVGAFGNYGTTDEILIVGNTVEESRIQAGGPGNRFSRVIVSGNIVRRAPVAAISVVAGSAAAEHAFDVVIEANVIEDANDVGIYFGDDQNSTGNLLAGRCIIANNVMHRIGGNAGIMVRGRHSLADVRVVGNIIDLTEASSFAAGPIDGVLLISNPAVTTGSPFQHLQIEQNQISGRGDIPAFGIRAAANALDGFSIRHNQISDAQTGLFLETTDAVGDLIADVHGNSIVGCGNGVLLKVTAAAGPVSMAVRLSHNVLEAPDKAYGITFQAFAGAVLDVDAHDNTISYQLGGFLGYGGDVRLRLVDNDFSGSTQAIGPYVYSLDDTELVAYRNRGFKTEERSVAPAAIPSGATSVVVPFSSATGNFMFAPEPYQIVVVPRGFGGAAAVNPGLVWVSAVSTTSFTVRCQFAPDQNLAFDWSVRPMLG